MEETNTSWKNHSFTLLIFGGIVALCFIFFVLGMLVGRNQGQRIAHDAIAAEDAKKPADSKTAEEFPLDIYSQATEEKPEIKLQPAPEPTVTGTSTTSPLPAAASAVPHRTDPPSEKAGPAVKPQQADAKPDAPAKTAGKTSAKNSTAPIPKPKEVLLQVSATQSEKQAKEELKKVQLKGFNGRILTGTTNNVQWHRVVVGPYKESDVNLAKSDLRAKGYKDVFLLK